MVAMNVIRLAISLFILVVIALAITGWFWTGAHQTASQSTASRVVLGLCVVAGIVGLTALWRTRQPRAPAARARRRREAVRSTAAERERAGVGPREP